jgi:hypothetical protein
MKFQEFLSFLAGFSMVGLLFTTKPASNTPIPLPPQRINQAECDRREISTQQSSSGPRQNPGLTEVFSTFPWPDLSQKRNFTPNPIDRHRTLIHL